MRRVRADTRLLLRLPRWLGDFVMAEPAVAACHAALEQGRLAALALAAPPRFLALLDGRFDGARRLAEDDAWRGHDAALFLDGSARGPWRAWRAGIGARWCWFRGGRGWLATDGFTPARECGARPLHVGRAGGGRRWLPRPFGGACAELVGLAGVPVDARAPRLVPSDAGRAAAAARLARAGFAADEPWLVLDASARPGSAKAAPAELWAATLVELQRAGAPRALLVTAPGEEALGRRLAALAPRRAAACVDAPPDLAELLALVAGARLFLGPDSGPRHLAAATGVPAVVVMGPSDPRHTADHTARARFVRRVVPCGPCHREVCPEPEPRTLRCFRELAPGEVAAAALAQLAGR